MTNEVEETVKREIAEAVRILREDGVTLRLKAIEERFSKHFPDENTEETTDDGKPKPPPKKEVPATGEPDKKPDAWWGDGLV